MNTKRHHEIACALLIDTHGRILLQQRDDVAGILHPGKVSLFGGHREEDETFLQCVVREVHEEIGYFVPAKRFEHLASLEDGEPDPEGGTVHAEYYVARDIPIERLIITEGSLVVTPAEKIFEWELKLTPAARVALKAYGVLEA